MKPRTHISRQDFIRLLTAGGAALLGMGGLPAWAASPPRGPSSSWSRLKFFCRGYDPDDWAVYPDADLNLITAIRDQTTANVIRRWNISDVARLETMTPYPFLFMHANTTPQLSDTDRANLREYLLRGGFLFAEDCVYEANGFGRQDLFFRQMADTELPKIFPDAKLERLPNDHPVFNCFHHFKNGLPHMQGAPHGLHGITHKGRLVVLLSPSDLHCAWSDGGESFFGRTQKIKALQMGVNIYLYAMTQTGGIPPKLQPDDTSPAVAPPRNVPNAKRGKP
jgi:hypothetical protein